MDPALLGAAALLAGWLGTFVAIRSRDPHRKAWRAIASDLSLDFDEHADRLRGHVYGEEVEARVISRDADGAYREVTVSCPVPVPLDMGLDVVSVPYSAGGAHDFERRFHFNADESARLGVLLSPALTKQLVAACFPDVRVRLDDRGVSLQRTVANGDTRWVPHALRQVARIIRELRRTSLEVACARRLQPLVPMWSELGALLNLRLVTTPLCLWGNLDDVQLHVYSVRTAAQAFAYEVRITFARELDLGLIMQSPALVARPKQLRAFDVPMGDPLFDHAFIVRTDDHAATQALFDADTRQRILELQHRMGPLWIMDDGLGIRLNVMPPAAGWLQQAVVDLAQLAEHVEERVHGAHDRRVGPYR